ncbi:MAG: FHA domain-containing protein [Verrucomicrobiaceae bacterium]|nr:FHA domain-containing protein [Verrucomicrobiaceae bacterium]
MPDTLIAPPHFLLWQQRRIPLTQPFLIGRAADNDVVLENSETSRRHAMLFAQGQDWWITDMGSRNGILLNGIRLHHARRLHHADELRIGTETFAFHSTESSPRAAATLPGATTLVSQEAQTDAAQGPIICELIVATADGVILEGDQAARWFFGKTLERSQSAAHTLLPAAVRQWLERQTAHSRPEGAALELLEADRRVIVTLCRRREGRCFLLVREESVQAHAARLQALGLSAREAEVMLWITEGKTNPEIALILAVTVHTVNRHVEHIFKKLDVDNRQRAIVTVLERLGK